MGNQISSIAYDEELQSLEEKGLSPKQLELVKEVFHSISRSNSQYVSAEAMRRQLKLPLEETKQIMHYCDLEEDGFDEYDFVCMVSLFTQASSDEKLSSIFKIFDDDSSQMICNQELKRLINCILTANNQGQEIGDEEIRQKIQELQEEFFLPDNELTLQHFIRISKEDRDFRTCMENIGVFKKGEFEDNFLEGLEEELNRLAHNHSEIDADKYEKVRQGVDFKEKKSEGLFTEEQTESGDQFMAVKPYVGAVRNSAPSKARDFKPDLGPPEMDLNLEYVHGFRTFDTRNNIHFVDEKHIMFHAAGVAIKMCVETRSRFSNNTKALYQQWFNNENSDDITAMAYCPAANLAAFGQIGAHPLINIVDTKSMDTVSVIVGDLTKGIGHLDFSPDGRFLIASAMNSDHDLALYDVSMLNSQSSNSNDRYRSKSNKKPRKPVLLCKARGTKDTVLGLKFSQNRVRPMNSKEKTRSRREDSHSSDSGAYEKTVYMVTRRDIYYVSLLNQKMKMKKVTGFGKVKKAKNICIGFLKGFDFVVGTHVGNLLGIKGCSVSQCVKGHSKIVYAMCSGLNNQMLITGGADGKVVVWDQGLRKADTFSLNKDVPLVDPRVRALAINESNKYIIVGTRGGQIVRMKFSDKSSGRGKKDLFMEVILDSHHSHELWGLAAHPSKPEFVTCSEDFLVSRWCLIEMRQLVRTHIKYQARVAAIHERSSKLAIGCRNGRVLILNYLTLEVTKEIRVSSKEISELKFSPSCREEGYNNGPEWLAVGAHDGKIYIYDASKGYKRKGILRGHHSTITHFDFTEEGDVLQSNCTSYELLYFDLNNMKQNTRGASSYKDTQWDSYTCTFGWWVQGIYPPCSDGTDVNSVDRSHDGKFLITGDDFGTVKIFNNPALKKTAFKKFLGHSSHVTNVRFSFNDEYVISAGGNDKSIFVWKNTSYDPAQSELREPGSGRNKLEHLGSQIDLPEDDEDFENDPELNSIFEQFKKLAGIDENDEIVLEANDGLFMEEDEEAGDQFMAVKPFLGEVKNSQPSNYFFEKGMDQPPEGNLKLHYIHGYRCFDAKNTAKFSNRQNHVVFASAALGVELNYKSNTQTFFNQHEEDVISFDLHPSRRIAATGQMAMKGKSKMIDIFVWDVETKEVLANLKGFHIRAIKLVRFSPSGKYLLTYGLDDDRSLAIYDWEQERLMCSSKVDKKNVLDSCFLLGEDKQFLSVGSRHCKIWNFNGCNIRSRRVTWPKRLKLEGRNSKTNLKTEPLISCASFNNTNFVVGTYKGKMIQIINGAMGKAWQVHTGPLSVFGHSSEHKKLFTGGRDGKVMVFTYERNSLTLKNEIITMEKPSSFSIGIKNLDTQDKQLLVGTAGSDLFVIPDFTASSSSINKKKKHILTGHFKGELWGLSTHPKEQFYVTVGDDCVAKLFDVFEKRCIKTIELPDKSRAVSYNSSGSKIAIICNMGHLLLYSSDLSKKLDQVDTGLSRAVQWVEDIKFSPDDAYLAFGHHGGISQVIVYKVRNSKLSLYGKIRAGLTSALLHLDWSKDSSALVVNSQAYELKFVNVPGKSLIRASGAKDIEWESWTCKLGFPVQGIFPGVDGTDVNTVCRSKSERILATGDDFQLVKIFRYPSVVKKSGFKRYVAHSSHVTRVRFMMEDNFLITTGGNDKTSIIWTTDFGAGNKKMIRQKSGIRAEETQQESEQWDDEDEFVTKKTVRHKFAEEIAAKGYSSIRGIDGSQNNFDEDNDEESGLFEEEEVEAGDEFMAVKPWLGAIKAPSDYLGFNGKQLAKPEIHGELDYVYGIRSKDCRNNMFLNPKGRDGHAAVGVCLGVERNTQNFMLGHKDDIISMDVHLERELVATGELGPKPRILIHDLSSQETLCEIRQGVIKGVNILKFSPSGRRLAAVCIDDDNHLAVFEARGGVHQPKQGWDMLKIVKGDRRKITSLEWMSEDELLTLGKRHARSWKIRRDSLKYTGCSLSKSCDYVVGTSRMEVKGKTHILAGAANGELQIWKNGSIKDKRHHHSRALDAIFSGNSNLRVVLTGGRDCIINFYNKDNLSHIGFINLNQVLTDGSISNRIRSIQIDPHGRNLYLSTYSSEIWKLSDLDLEEVIMDIDSGKAKKKFDLKALNFLKKNQKQSKQVNLLQYMDLDRIQKTQIMSGHYAPSLKWTNEVWGLDVIDRERVVSVSDDATLRIWNVNTRTIEAVIKLNIDVKGNRLPRCSKTGDLQDSCKLRSVSVSKSGQWAAVGCKDGTVRLVDLVNYKQVKVFKTRKRWIQCIRFSPNDELLAVGSHDTKIDIFTVKNSQSSTQSVPKFVKLSCLKKHRAFITHLDFSLCGRYIHSVCGGYELLFFDAFTGEQMTSGATMLRDEVWDSWSTTLGWPVQGVFQPEWDGSDVNMVDRSKQQHNGDTLIAAADDFSKIRIYKYPCLKNSAKSIILEGHSSHVTNVKWSPDDSFIFSAGGEDQTIMQWRISDN